MSFSFEKPADWNTLPLFRKIQYYKNIIGPQYAPYVDKIEAKRIVKEMADDAIEVAELIRILSDPTDFNISDLDSSCILKSAHGCKMNINLDNTVSIQEVHKKLQLWNRAYIGNNEQHYKYVKPRFFIERKITDKYKGITDSAIVFLIRCIRGEPFVIGVRDDAKKKQNSYDLNWTPVKPIELPGFEKPEQISKMIELARLLSKPFEFVRVDFYIGADDKIYFSEFTFTPSGGAQFYKLDREIELGKLWN